MRVHGSRLRIRASVGCRNSPANPILETSRRAQGAFGGDPAMARLANTQCFELGTPGHFIGELFDTLAQSQQGFSGEALMVHVLQGALVNHVVQVWSAQQFRKVDAIFRGCAFETSELLIT